MLPPIQPKGHLRGPRTMRLFYAALRYASTRRARRHGGVEMRFIEWKEHLGNGMPKNLHPRLKYDHCGHTHPPP